MSNVIDSERELVDLSVYQRGISWNALKAAGIGGALLKATEGVGFEDAAFAQHRAEARRVGVPIGAYHFARPDTVGSERDAIAEADWFLHVARPARGDLLPALDLEVPGRSTKGLLEWALAWLRRVGAEIGEPPFLYTFPSFYRERMRGAAAAADCSLLWLADWGPNDGRRHAPRPIGAWRRIALHQYTSRGQIRGVSSPLDVNRLGDGFSLGSITVGQNGRGRPR